MLSEVKTFNFVASPYILKDFIIVRLPESVSKQLPSRSQIAVNVELNNHSFATLLEPDGYLGHYVKIHIGSEQAQGLTVGQDVKVSSKLLDEWPEPAVDTDIAQAITLASEKVRHKWDDITPRARTEWVRWINSTANEATRRIRIEKTVSKLDGKHRRPCCFNLAACTDAALAISGRLILPGMHT